MAAYSEDPAEPEGTQHQEQENQLAQVLHDHFCVSAT